ncbi:16S rRNA m(2)G 1207 methyltransferase [Pacificibacter maritimus]|uniref:16S rRNA m(2)G 1207 methyltransferase n=1 Tax=Pacificibacter maritimus TaxID=762213 RepID=A0A3N4UDH7_9RHOB|nr:class I SAM-dependent methyltransferase [Pacificibacter maritimus]RPE66485.1 16S rRNA m(2)G 1207 methyltransferase [Pacificibacter maritimus]
MVSPRLSLVLDGQDQPDRAVVYRPRMDANLDALKGCDVQIVQGFKPDFDAFERAGFAPQTVADGAFDLAVVAVPRAKAEARALIADAAQRSQRVIVDGQKTDGIDSLLKEVRKRKEISGVVSKAHGKAFLFDASQGSDDFSDWADPGVLSVIDGFKTRLGVFSSDRVDKASAALVAALPEKLPANLADFGAGWGYLSRHILEREGVKKLHIVEAEAAALDCARLNVDDPRAVFHWADATEFSIKPDLDGIIMNPPFHTTRAADPALGQAFIAAAARCLAPHGQLWMVANRHLPYEAKLAEMFGKVVEIGGTPAFKILQASNPLRARKRPA